MEIIYAFLNHVFNQDRGLILVLVGLLLLSYFYVRIDPASEVRRISLQINQKQCEEVFSLAVCEYILGRQNLIEADGFYWLTVRRVFILYLNNNRNRVRELNVRQIRFQLQELCGRVGHPEVAVPIEAIINHAINALKQHGINPNTRMNVSRVIWTIIHKLHWRP